MAPRTPAQQEAYNEARRKKTAEAKAAKAAADASVKAVKAERKAAKAEKAKGTGKSAPAKEAPVAAKAPVKAKAAPKHVAAQVKTLGADSLLPPERLTDKQRAAVAKARGVDFDEVPRGKPSVKLSGEVLSDPLPRTKPQGPAGPSTIARSYQREFRGTGATKRGNMLQVTVTFTEAQFTTLKQRAELYQCSLAETIRKCVIAGPNLADSKPRSE